MATSDSFGVWFPVVRTGGGVDRYTERLAAALRSRGVRAEISWLPPRAEYLPWTVAMPVPPQWAKVAHVNSWLHGRFVPSHLALVTTLHSCVHNRELEAYKTWSQSLYHRFWVRKLETVSVGRADYVISVSKDTEKVAKGALGEFKGRVIHNWVGNDCFSTEKVPCVLRGKQVELVFVGNVSKRKGTDLLLKIMWRLGSSYHLRVTATYDSLRAFGPVPDNVTCVGKIHDVDSLKELYRRSHFMVFPSRLEGLSLAVLEAMACGVPVVASNCSSFPEVIRNGYSGILCSKNDVQSFVSAIVDVSNASGAHEAMAHRARNVVFERFSEDQALSRYMNTYSEALECKERGWHR